MTSSSREKAEQNVQTIVEGLQRRVVDYLKAHGPQRWETLVIELNQCRNRHIHTALKELQQWKTIRLRGWMVGLTEEVSHPQLHNGAEREKLQPKSDCGENERENAYIL
jgi:hypothetical protein